ncbi:hypothetical protein [Arthrobacter sp. NPDC093139]|uniref:hypothetical protein n=1 Tax=Arthrobacter sp. NPDC093139 TaxID=3363945 RepID=UPI0037FCB442
MASRESDTRLRIPLALVVIVLAAAGLFLTWVREIELWFRISGTLMCAILLLWATIILIGKTKSGGLLLSRRRWKQFTVLGVVVAAAITLGVIISILAARPGSRSPLLPPLYPMLLGLTAAYLYEPESPPLMRGPATDRDARVWKRNAIVLAIAGIGLGCITVIAAAADNTIVRIFFEGPAVVLLITAAVMGMMLRARNRRRTNP